METASRVFQRRAKTDIEVDCSDLEVADQIHCAKEGIVRLYLAHFGYANTSFQPPWFLRCRVLNSAENLHRASCLLC
jgi:hypothetical protein